MEVQLCSIVLELHTDYSTKLDLHINYSTKLDVHTDYRTKVGPPYSL